MQEKEQKSKILIFTIKKTSHYFFWGVKIKLFVVLFFVVQTKKKRNLKKVKLRKN